MITTGRILERLQLRHFKESDRDIILGQVLNFCQTRRKTCDFSTMYSAVRHGDFPSSIIKQGPSSFAHLPSPFQSPKLLLSLSVAVKSLVLLLPEIVVFTSEVT